MSEIGKIIKRMDLESNIIKMEINMKVDGKIIKGMDRELSGFATPKTNSGESTPETGKMT